MESPRETDWHVVVPVKGGPGAKSRLRRSLDGEALVAAIIHDTLDVVSDVVTPARVIVVTGDAQEVAHARASHFGVVADPGTGLNEACLTGVRFALTGGARAVAILLGDHPALTPAELRSCLREGADHETFFVPDADGLGTALVGTTDSRLPDLAFGADSAALHDALGHTRLDLDLPGLRHDVDDEVSLHHAATHLTLGPRTRDALGR